MQFNKLVLVAEVAWIHESPLTGAHVGFGRCLCEYLRISMIQYLFLIYDISCAVFLRVSISIKYFRGQRFVTGEVLYLCQGFNKKQT